jgi:hypothetical protein
MRQLLFRTLAVLLGACVLYVNLIGYPRPPVETGVIEYINLFGGCLFLLYGFGAFGRQRHR